jgi:hypothetical protein
MTYLAEAKSGFRLALMTVVGIALMYLSVFGLLRIGPGPQRNVPLGIGVVLAVSSVLWATSALWSKWVFGFCCANVLRLAVMGIIGRAFAAPSMPASRILFWELASIFAVLALVTYRFTDTPPVWWESLILVFAVMSLVNSIFLTVAVEWILIAPLLLGGASAYRYLIACREQRPS